MSVNTHLPEEFIKLMEASVGMEASNIFVDRYSNSEAASAGKTGVTSIRINPAKGNNILLDDLANTYGLEGVKWCSNGYYLKERPVFTLDPLFHAGAYYVQEASSMFAEAAIKAILDDSSSLKEKKNLKVLDLCAAPGGKSTHIASVISKESLLVSNEVIRSRSVILADNMAKWGCDNVVVTNNDPRDFTKLSGYFDIIFVDAPCSGEGMFIKDHDSIGEWSLANVELCAGRQRRILQDIWGALAPGGYLVYSTCTFNHFENDDNLKYIIDEFGAEAISADELLDSFVGKGVLRSEHGGYQFVPGLIEGEGQFLAIVRKPGDDCSRENSVGAQRYANDKFVKGDKAFKAGKRDKAVKAGKGANGGKNMLQGFNYLPAADYEFALCGDIVKAYPKQYESDIKYLESLLKIVSSGIAVANVKGKDFIPHADFALQNSLTDMASSGVLPKEIAAVDVDRETALRFLAKEPVVLKDAPLGYILIMYKGLGLGFVKNLGNRTNNLLPMARRIRMDINK